jgi:hypothetical protein
MIKYRSGNLYKYQLAEDYQIPVEIDSDSLIVEPDQPVFIRLYHNVLTIKAGYAWDGPSGPSVDTKNFMRGSLVHDALYQLLRAGKIDQKYRKYADQLLREMCRQDGMSAFRAWYVYRTVRAFAGFAAKRKDNPVITAP